MYKIYRVKAISKNSELYMWIGHFMGFNPIQVLRNIIKRGPNGGPQTESQKVTYEFFTKLFLSPRFLTIHSSVGFES